MLQRRTSGAFGKKHPDYPKDLRHVSGYDFSLLLARGMAS
jgi:hypothetical protein